MTKECETSYRLDITEYYIKTKKIFTAPSAFPSTDTPLIMRAASNFFSSSAAITEDGNKKNPNEESRDRPVLNLICSSFLTEFVMERYDEADDIL
mmetsp:Transcript_25484/g.38165  ORF Transcript_25484/g.38165 Transcript_25484/m.38165 type:complete len:95 (-) Transcript_25484:33-317(-)